ncbi:MAG: TorD/DmsD family molecular chaperone [Planctomycetota bacterium]|jgi:TorA maturation chaperone TorD
MPTVDKVKGLELKELASARQTVYSFLRAAFSEPPSGEQLDALRASDFLCEAGKLFSEHVLAPLTEYARTDTAIADLQREGRQEFMNLFKVPGGQYVTPYESVYRDTREIAGKKVKGLLMGQCAVDVQKWYQLAALEIADEYKDLPDHICLEFNYLAHLCGKEREFDSAGDEAKLARTWLMQRDFLAGHIIPWIGLLGDKIHEKSQHTYFRAVADMAVEFTGRDLATLEGLLGKSSGHSSPQYDEIPT